MKQILKLRALIVRMKHNPTTTNTQCLHPLLPVVVLLFLSAGVAPLSAAKTSPIKETPSFPKTLVIQGPFPVFDKEPHPEDREAKRKAFDHNFLEGLGGETGIWPGRNTEPLQQHNPASSWRAIDAQDGVIDLGAALGRKSYAVAYAYAEVEARSPGSVMLGIRSDDAVKVWLEGQPIHENFVFRALDEDEDLVPVQLHEGRNGFLFKVLNDTGDWKLAVRILDASDEREALLRAARKGNRKTVAALLDRGASPTVVDPCGNTPLHLAAYNGRQDVVELLLSRGCSINARAIDGSTPIRLARRAGFLSLSALLVKQGADPKLQPRSPSEQVEALFMPVIPCDAPGAAVAVLQRGELVYQGAFGLANLEHGVPITAHTKFRLISLSKGFTAMAVLRLREKSLLGLDDPMGKYLPGFPHGTEITIRQLLTHTSGIGDTPVTPENREVLPKVPYTVEERIGMFRNQPLQFRPGQQWSYSNEGYMLLGAIIGSICKQPYEKALQAEVFQPLDMRHSGYDRPKTIIAGRATGYSKKGGVWQNAEYFDMGLFDAAGALYSDLEDMCRWAKGQEPGQLVSAATLAEAFSPVKLADGKEAGYGFGWIIGKHRGLREVRAMGSMPGFMSYMLQVPEQRFTVVALANSDGLDLFGLAHQTAEIYLHKEMEPRSSQ